MKRVLAIIIAMIVLSASVATADFANMTFASKSFNVAAGGQTPYFYGLATNNSGSIFFMPGKGEQRATVTWLNKIPLNTSVRVEYSDFVVSRMWNITNVSNVVEL